MRAACLVLAACLLAAPLAQARATTWITAMNGVDGPGCGTKDAPCRTISAAYAHAVDGDTVLVGPGFYGDADGDGAYDHPGDEAGSPVSGCVCLLRLTKRVTVRSRDGADATIIDGGAVSVILSFESGSGGSTFGGPNAGFTLTGGVGIAANVLVEAPDVHLVGIVARDMAGTAFNDFSTTTFENVHVIGAGMSGFRLENDSTLAGCIVQGASQAGYLFNGGDGTISKSLAVGNRSSGVQVNNGSATLDGMSLLANVFAGVVGNGSDVALTRSTIMGNARGADGCGVTLGVSGSISAANDFWGAAGGPESAGADLVCTNSAAVPFEPFKKAEVKVVPKAVR